MIEVRNLKKSFHGNVILQNVSFKVEQGDSLVIIGGSGCGKSTLLRCLDRLIVPEEGEILFRGQNILDRSTDVDEFRRHVGMVYQQFNLFSHLNVMENMILAPMKVLKMSQDEAVARAETLLEQVGMANRRWNMPEALSGGQKQRVAIARTLMMAPDMILFDEPTSALDPTMVDEVESVIRRLIDGGMTSVIVTHEMRFAESIAKQVMFLAEQGIYETGTPKQIYHEPRRELTRQFIYRARMQTLELDWDTVDFYALGSQIRAHLSRYGLTRRQSTALSHFIEEILVRIMSTDHGARCTLTMTAADNGTGHRLFMEFPGMTEDPLTCEIIDPLGRKIADNYCESITSRLTEAGKWEITAVL